MKVSNVQEILQRYWQGHASAEETLLVNEWHKKLINPGDIKSARKEVDEWGA